MFLSFLAQPGSNPSLGMSFNLQSHTPSKQILQWLLFCLLLNSTDKDAKFFLGVDNRSESGNSCHSNVETLTLGMGKGSKLIVNTVRRLKPTLYISLFLSVVLFYIVIFFPHQTILTNVSFFIGTYWW